MADLSLCPPLTRDSVIAAHSLIRPHIHHTPLLSSSHLTTLASSPLPSQPPTTPTPTIRLHFKPESLQRVGAFKARGAFHALSRLALDPSWDRSTGVVTHSSGNHAQALALAAREMGVKATVVMPSVSAAPKVAATRGYGAEVVFSGSTAAEREGVVGEVVARQGGRVVVPYDHPDIILGQGTAALELQQQFAASQPASPTPKHLHAILTPLGGGGLLSGTALACEGTPTLVFGSEPSFQDADDGRRAFYSASGERITAVSSLTIADGLRTPVGAIPWSIIHGRKLVRGIYAVTEDQIKAALRLVYERMKLVVEPSAVVPLAVVLFNEEFRSMVAREGGEEGWDIGIILTGGNVSLEALGKLFAE
ncbi:tryptophan synthase beta subunit-like PLP-dependent enzyme [Podospora conica]|nr:tryptophan synthase beta subunit-like PLP-dependent enzyme [Schizothecium conicum]